MSDYYKLTSTTNSDTDWTSEVVLEVDDRGTPTKVVRAGEPVQLSAADREKIEKLGYKVEQSSKKEAEDFAASGGALGSSDVSGAAPLLGDSESPNQSVSDQEQGGGTSKSNDKNK